MLIRFKNKLKYIYIIIIIFIIYITIILYNLLYVNTEIRKNNNNDKKADYSQDLDFLKSLYIVILFIFFSCSTTNKMVIKDNKYDNDRRPIILYSNCTDLYKNKKDILNCISDKLKLLEDSINSDPKITLLNSRRYDDKTIIQDYEICYGQICKVIEVRSYKPSILSKIREHTITFIIGVFIGIYL